MREEEEEPASRRMGTPSPLHSALFASSSAESLLSVEGTEGSAGLGGRHAGPIADAVSFMALAAQALMQDEFSRCFDSQPRMHHRNKRPMGQALWLAGVVVRYAILLPLRLLAMAMAMSFFVALLLWTLWTGGDRQAVFCLGCRLWLMSVGAVVRHHGPKQRHPGRPHLYVANHTSYLDFILLSSHKFPLAPLGQIHGGLFGLLQQRLLQSGLGALVFNRDEQRDRKIVAQRMREHTLDDSRAPLLVFPEGTCVNNDATVLFHKGAFDLGADVVPVAIKYNKRLFDPYWNTREQTFSQNVLYLMTRWLIMVDVWWLPVQARRAGESAIDFSNRVKALVSERAGLANLQWDGYMKNFMRPAFRDKLVASVQRQYAASLLHRHPSLSASTTVAEGDPAASTTSTMNRDEPIKPAIVVGGKRQRSMSAVTTRELERSRSHSPLLPLNHLNATEPMVDMASSLTTRRWMPTYVEERSPRSFQGESNASSKMSIDASSSSTAISSSLTAISSSSTAISSSSDGDVFAMVEERKIDKDEKID